MAAGGVTDVEPIQGGNALDKKRWEDEAMEWYLKAADANQADACYNLALLAFEVLHASSIPHCLFLRVDWLQMFPVALLCAMQKPMVSCVCVCVCVCV